ncbi:MAG: HyaD/HybD family hydrogenase maturation endopeptidase [Myxococcaceae bacterium]|nr:HyaD/HybD family hydrogenase maturation endopeptidase [Myxococcaceae bacterium]
MARTPALVLGIGNLLWADEGFGVRCVEALDERFEFPDGVVVMDGGTQGLGLVHDVASAERVLVLDAIDFGDDPGTLRVIEGDDVPTYAIAKKMSMHQTGFQDVLAAASLLGSSPAEVVLIGVQPRDLEDFGGALTAPVASRLDDAVALAVERLRGWGFTPKPRTVAGGALLAKSLGRTAYESGRPSAQDACRIGDIRLLAAHLAKES